jgi:small subunit ribosomal protein S17
MENKDNKRNITGIIVSDKMQKTRVVAVSRLKKHPKYLKYYTVTTKFKAHDENNEYKTGETVIIEESRPLSREKRWTIIGRVVNKQQK